jgi:adenosine deaminase
MYHFKDSFIKKIPKTDLHVHLDGSLRIPTLIELAKSRRVELPSYTEDGLNELVFKKNYASLDEYLKGFGLTCAVMRDKDALEKISYELAIDNFEEGVRYLEVRFAPQLHMSDLLSFEEVMEAVDKGLRHARRDINAKITEEDEPHFEYGIIVCAMRFCNEYFSPFYKTFFNIHKYSNLLEKIRLASLELAKAAIELHDNSDIQIVGFDIAGSEYGYPAENHKESYDYVHKHFLMKTVHAGEAYGPESIFQAITKLHSDRIGHGLFLFDETKIYADYIKDKKKYVNDLANYIAEKRISLEVCLTSNLQTVPEIKTIKDHPLKKMLESKLSVTFCTDNRLVSHTSVSNEIKLALDNFDITNEQLKNIIIYGFKRSFFYRPYHDKRDYVRKIIDYYEKIENEENVLKG